jgi:hypothetical protein
VYESGDIGHLIRTGGKISHLKQIALQQQGETKRLIVTSFLNVSGLRATQSMRQARTKKNWKANSKKGCGNIAAFFLLGKIRMCGSKVVFFFGERDCILEWKCRLQHYRSALMLSSYFYQAHLQRCHQAR